MSDVNESLKADEDIISYEELFCERNSLAVILEDSEECESSAGEEDESNQDSDVAFSGHESETKSNNVQESGRLGSRRTVGGSRRMDEVWTVSPTTSITSDSVTSVPLIHSVVLYPRLAKTRVAKTQKKHKKMIHSIRIQEEMKLSGGQHFQNLIQQHLIIRFMLM